MTVSNTIASITVLGDGVTTIFNYNFLIPYQDDGVTPAVQVQLVDNATLVAVTLAPSTYSITGVNNPSGGTLTYPTSGSALASGKSLRISRGLNITQPTAVANETFYPHVVEQVADRITLMLQQLALGNLVSENGAFQLIDSITNGDITHAATPNAVYDFVTTNGNTSSGEVSVMAYGAVIDARNVTDGVVVASSTALTSATAAFTPADVGKMVVVGYDTTFTHGANGTCANLSATFTTATSTFVATDVGKRINFGAEHKGEYSRTITAYVSATQVTLDSAIGSPGFTAGNVKFTMFRTPHNTTIAAYVSPTQVTLAVAAPAAKTGSSVWLGTDNWLAFQLAINAGYPIVRIPQGKFMLSQMLDYSRNNIRIVGAGSNATRLIAANTNMIILNAQSRSYVGWTGITFDNVQQFNANAGFVNINSCTFVYADDFQLINMGKYGLGINGLTQGIFSNFYIQKSDIWIAQNQGITLTDLSASANLVKFINGTMINTCQATRGQEIAYISVNVERFGFGGGFVVEQATPRTSQNVFINCSANDGYGYDTNDTIACGMENWSTQCIVQNFMATGNAGQGINWGANNSVLANSTFVNNGLGGAAPGWPAIDCAAGNATYSSINSLIIGNRAYDTGPARQTYGYREVNDVYIRNNKLWGNHFLGNAVGEYSLARGNAGTLVDGALTLKTTYAGTVLGAGGTAFINTTVTGAALGDSVTSWVNVGTPSMPYTVLMYSRVDSANTVLTCFSNYTGASVTIAACDVYLAVTKRQGY